MAHSLADLQDLTMKLRDDRPALEAQGVELIAWGPDAESNTVIARIADYSAAHARALQRRYGGPGRITVKPWTGELPKRV